MIWQYRGETARGVDDYADQMKSPSLRDRTIAARAVRFSEELAAAAIAAELCAATARMRDLLNGSTR